MDQKHNAPEHIAPEHFAPAATLALGAAFAAAPALAPEFIGYAAGQLPVAIARHAVQPAGYAFAIWGVIYTWLFASAIFGLWRRAGSPAWAATRPALMGATALGTLWLFIAASAPLAATAVIVVMAALCLTAFLRADTKVDRWILSAPLAIFAGWLCAASLVSVGIMLGGYGLMSHQNAALMMVALLVAGAIWVQSRQPAMPVYGATVIWAILAVAQINWQTERLVALTALAAAAIVGAATLTFALRKPV